jgi:hypothetical protein
MWLALEPLHAITYFAPEVRESLDAAGMRGFWMGYFAARAAPLGPVGPAVVEALFFNFNPAMVRRALPGAWALATPEAVLSSRLHAVDEALWRLFGDDLRTPDVVAAAQAARKAADAADCGGRALAAAHQALDWPTVPHLALWQAATILREHRGDGHVLSLVAEDIGGLQAHVLAVAAGASTAELQQQSRRWSADDWQRGVASLVERDWLTPTGELTELGSTVRRRVEDGTDRLAEGPYRALTEEECTRLAQVGERMTRRLVAAEVLPFPNPIGLPPPAPDPVDGDGDAEDGAQAGDAVPGAGDPGAAVPGPAAGPTVSSITARTSSP